MKNLKLIAILSLVGVPLAGAATPQAPASARVPTSGLAPETYQTYMDAYNQGTGHFLFGTADPNGDNCLLADQASQCAPVDLVSRAAYVGSFENAGTNTFTNTSGIDGVSIFVFDAGKLGKAKNYALKLNEVQNFTGRGYHLSAKVLEQRGDNGVDPGAEGAFKNIGPFGIPAAGALTTIVADARADRGDVHTGGTAVAANGPLVAHPADPAAPYLTFDRTSIIHLGDISDAVEAAVASGVTYTTCRNSCGVAIRNADCDQTISNPLYIAVGALMGGGDRANERVQDGLNVDALLHLHGDCDFAGESSPGQTTKVELLAW